jgi:hypothetical protein
MQLPKFRKYYRDNRERLVAYAREYVKANKDQVVDRKKRYYRRESANFRNKRFMTSYGITAAQRDAMEEAQQSRCAICGTHASECPKQELYVDHCHTSGKIRELLCQHCNTSLGHFKDSVFTLYAAISYLEKHHPEKRVSP